MYNKVGNLMKKRLQLESGGKQVAPSLPYLCLFHNHSRFPSLLLALAHELDSIHIELIRLFLFGLKLVHLQTPLILISIWLWPCPWIQGVLSSSRPQLPWQLQEKKQQLLQPKPSQDVHLESGIIGVVNWKLAVQLFVSRYQNNQSESTSNRITGLVSQQCLEWRTRI